MGKHSLWQKWRAWQAGHPGNLGPLGHPWPLLCPADPTQDMVLELDGQRVAVPQGQPMPCPEFSSSSFSQSEYLIYLESQCRLRYLVQIHL